MLRCCFWATYIANRTAAAASVVRSTVWTPATTKEHYPTHRGSKMWFANQDTYICLCLIVRTTFVYKKVHTNELLYIVLGSICSPDTNCFYWMPKKKPQGRYCMHESRRHERFREKKMYTYILIFLSFFFPKNCEKETNRKKGSTEKHATARAHRPKSMKRWSRCDVPLMKPLHSMP